MENEMVVSSKEKRHGDYRDLSNRESRPARRLEAQGRMMLTLEQAGEELKRKGIIYEKARQSQKITSSHIEEIKKRMVPLIRQYNYLSGAERPQISDFRDAYYALSQVIHLGSREHFKHSFFDDGGTIFLWSGHSDTPQKGYVVRKSDAKYFKWSLEEDKDIAADLESENDLGYFSE